MNQSSSRLYTFGDFRLNCTSNLLIHKGKPIPLTPKVFDTLLLLVENAGRLVDKDEFTHRLWPNTFVGDEALARNIYVLRKVLEESANGQEYIATVPKRGYRFVAAVKELAEEGLVEGYPKPAEQHAATIRFAGASAALLVIVLAAGYAAWKRFRPPTQPSPQGRIMLAVLPFQNLSGDPNQEYVSDGLTEEIITQLGRMQPDRLGVIARTSATAYKGSKKNTAQIGRELGVHYILEGSVRREGQIVRVSAQLIQTKDQTHLWAQNYDRQLSDMLTVEGEVAQAIAAQVRIKLTPEQVKMVAGQRLTNPEAEDAYLRGRYFWNKRTGEGFKTAIEYFNQATAKEPAYAAAYAGLADSYLLLGGYNFVPQNQSIPKARAAAQKALQLDGSLADAHATLGLIAMNYDWNWAEAERQYRQAIALNPSYATAHHWYAEYLTAVGRFDEGLAEIGVAEQLDPLSVIVSGDRCKFLYFGRKYDSSIKLCQATIEMDPSFVMAHNWLALAKIEKGMFAESIGELERVRARDDTRYSTALLVYAYAVAGRRSEAERELERLKQDSKQRYMDPANFTMVYLGLGDKEQTFAWLEREYMEHSVGLTSLKVNPAYDPLRSDPRFADLMRRIALPQ